MQERARYMQLQPKERTAMASMKLTGHSTRPMARVLCRPASTVSRELHRNACFKAGHSSRSAMTTHARRRSAARPAAKLHVNSVAYSVMITLLDWNWSPQQIAATLAEPSPISPSAMWNTRPAEARGELRKRLIAFLRQRRNSANRAAATPTGAASCTT